MGTTTVELLDGPAARAAVGEVLDLYAEVFAEPPYNEGPDQVGEFAGYFDEHTRDPRFGMSVARDCAGRLVGIAYACGMAAGGWWRNATGEPPAEVVAADKAVVYELAVRPARRGRGLGRRLLDAVLADRPEPWATLAVNLDAPARHMYERWGWQPMGVLRSRPGWPASEAMVLNLGQTPAASNYLAR